jgi:hypothetical protein
MSKKKIRTCCLVIDASVPRAAGSLESGHPTGTRCRDFLIAVRGVGHRMAWSQALKAEWDRHQSAFALQWLLTMFKLDKLRRVEDEQSQELRQAITDHSKDRGVVAVMLKDAHLIEAALATDLRIAAMDDAARGHFIGLAETLDPLGRIACVNPAVEDEQVIEWIEKGAPPERSRRLRP